MAYTSLGLDIGTRSVRYVLLQNTNQIFTILQSGELPYNPEYDEADEGLPNVLTNLREQLFGKNKTQIDAIGMTVDPTQTLSTHRLFPFNTPNEIRQILPLQLNDIWTINEDTQLTFEVGGFVDQNKPEGKDAAAKDANAADDSLKSGYDVKILNYPKSKLLELIEKTRQARIDPHIMLPSNEALNLSLNSLFSPQSGIWILLDIGELVTTVTVIGENLNSGVYLSRSFKVGSVNIDNAIAETFSISPAEARQLKESSGFVSVPGAEATDFSRYLFNQKLTPTEFNPVQLAQACARGLEQIAAPIRQTLLNFITKNRQDPNILYVCGGGSKLVGLREWFQQNFEIRCSDNLPTALNMEIHTTTYPIDAVAAAVIANNNIEKKYQLNLRQGSLAHKGNLAFIQEHGWILAALVILIIVALSFMTVTKNRTIKQEHDQLKTALEQASQNVFGKKLLTYQQIEKEINQSQGFNYIPEKTAFSHFSWISSQVNDNLADVDMDLSSIDIDTQRKVIRIRGEITGDEGLPKFLQLMEQYECFPDDIPEPGTQHVKDKVVFNLSIDAQCSSGDDSE